MCWVLLSTVSTGDMIDLYSNFALQRVTPCIDVIHTLRLHRPLLPVKLFTARFKQNAAVMNRIDLCFKLTV